MSPSAAGVKGDFAPRGAAGVYGPSVQGVSVTDMYDEWDDILKVCFGDDVVWTMPSSATSRAVMLLRVSGQGEGSGADSKSF
mmetsp:Transcript_140342/g.269171  ORF Transcript_140342/g.269171 Transcript_140342/m.269171 type:complete len:82 (+) Transcript_140342:1222-1467(+)